MLFALAVLVALFLLVAVSAFSFGAKYTLERIIGALALSAVFVILTACPIMLKNAGPKDAGSATVFAVAAVIVAFPVLLRVSEDMKAKTAEHNAKKIIAEKTGREDFGCGLVGFIAFVTFVVGFIALFFL